MKVMLDNALIKVVIILSLMLVRTSDLAAQRLYRPFIQEGKTWNYETKDGKHFSCVIMGDTIIGEKSYSKLYSIKNNGETLYESALREENYIVYQVVRGSEKETSLFDFDLDSLETMYDEAVGEMKGVGCKKSVIEEVYISGFPCRVITYIPYGILENGEIVSTTGLGHWFEGIGGPEGIRQDATLLSVYEGEKCIFDRRKGTLKNYADHTVCEERPEDYIPFAATGKKWVHIVLNDCPTYYNINTYTIKDAVLKDGYVWFNMYKESVNQDRKVSKSDKPIYCIREWDGCVYLYDDSVEGNSIKVYDMNASVGDSVSIYGTEIGLDISTSYLDSIYVLEEKCISNCEHDYRALVIESQKREYQGEYERHTIIEGLGDYNNFMNPKFYVSGFTGQGYEQIIECYLGDNLIFQDLKGYIKDVYLGISAPTLTTPPSLHAFDLQGRRLTREPAHGIFIKDGKKVMR